MNSGADKPAPWRPHKLGCRHKPCNLFVEPPILGGQITEAPVAIAAAHAPHMGPEGRAQVPGVEEAAAGDLR